MGKLNVLDSTVFKEPAANYWSRDMPVDPNEPIYCNCRRVAYGEMICCDNSEVGHPNNALNNSNFDSGHFGHFTG